MPVVSPAFPPSISGNQTLWAWNWDSPTPASLSPCTISVLLARFFFFIVNDNFFTICSFSFRRATLSLFVSIIFSSISYEQLSLIFPVAQGLNFCTVRHRRRYKTFQLPSSSSLVPELRLWQEDHFYL